ncbi:SEC-C motif-containing protein [Sporobacter termitidis DSM 10068]|uniref:SEC-C motif-containing protein n=1 Tax=Sporobacter termitidis DSM 10068 TaxID=1123282 RepID=A0A1M5WUT4_9FIRM|nr:SEC-C metal-binding domain-containing protein [Sporobacter termitidis]SHH91357.1 SEC-C motif-containing protein [Sporobacter termitidis DSM 10068]
MSNDTACFCGSGKKHADCHGHIRCDSLVAKLYRLQARCGAANGSACRSPLRSQCFLVSEAEFVQLLDDMLRHWTAEEIRQVVDRSWECRRYLEAERPDIAEKAGGKTTPGELASLNETALPFPCVFLRGEDCAARRVRPLLCLGCGASIDFVLLRYKDGVLVRRPAPLFYYFTLIFRDGVLPDNIPDAPFYRDMLTLSEADYIEKLAEYAELKTASF